MIFSPSRTSARRALIASASLLAFAAPAWAETPSKQAVLETYADIALASYSDALASAKALDAATDALIETPSAETLAAAKDAWRASRPSYMQTEVFRFGNPIVDAWEGRVNAWPLDEGLIDYVAPAYGTGSDSNALYTANVIASDEITIGGESVDVTTITPALLQDKLQEAGGVEANVATGYHAVEFLLWGQDLNGTEAGAGDRPATDFAEGEACTNGSCEKRSAFLDAATDLLITDLEEMVGNWETDGAARTALLEDEDKGIAAILTGMGSLSYGELAGERMKLGLLLHDPEEEHDCFSDNTHASHYYDGIGIQNAYLGRYERADGGVVEGAALADLVEASAPDVNEELKADLEASIAKLRAIYDAAESGEAYDQQIGEGNAEGNARVQEAIDALIAQTRTIERAIAALDLGAVSIEGSDSLDNASAVFQ
ncbi:imelysin family protein [Fulvimarina sp. 2208YS6-2-32]|uniref:Imelysin family protein n=1 Tax=Fulvimarina uroteuthidis TaxID=3098149 RepID=A0ABU5I1G5_9HYPH|nr:imelysin family protein [Fulvimarina sp. 2208YS6-2-32]MDY8108972.1 imelysin family protein [Fulvimarina sp. 2208YS6-2-32]